MIDINPSAKPNSSIASSVVNDTITANENCIFDSEGG
jgi:hypothetical protein